MKNGRESLAALSAWAADESAAIKELFGEVGERLRVARRARSLGELLRDQWDLLPRTGSRLRSNFQRRRGAVQSLIGID